MEILPSSNQVFPDGSITKIVYHNFLTYDDVECRPGPNLNVIIGPNGNGKSSVICGICLAVGGNPKILGRSERLGDYIKHMRDEGFVELSIADSQKGEQRVKVVLQRPNSCKYFINGSNATQRAVDNPCTFLAQDKVKSFSEQSPVDLLMNTERAGNPHLLEKHEELIKKKKHESVHIESARELQQRLNIIDGELTALLPRVENYKKKEILRTKIAILMKKKTILDFHECMKSYTESQEALDKVQITVDDTKKQIEGVRMENDKRSKKEDEYETNHSEILRRIREITKDVNALKNKNLYSEKVRDAIERFNRLKVQKDNWEQEVNQMRSQVDRVRESVVAAKEEMKGYEEFKKEASQKAQKCAENEDNVCRLEDELSAEERKLSRERDRLRDEEKSLRQVMEGRLRILENLRSNMADEAWRWYEGNRSMFRYPVYVPVLHMTVPDTKSAMLLENLIALRDLPMFIFGCKEDEALLTDRKHNWKLNSTVISPSQVDMSLFKTKLTPEMEEFGFTHFAIDMFDSVDIIKQFLCSVAKLHQVPIGSSRTNDLYDKIRTTFLKKPYRLYLTDKYRVKFTVSKYGSHEILGQQSELRSPRILLGHSKPLDDRRKFHAEAQRISDLETDLRNRRLELNQTKQKIQEEKEELKTQQAEWRKRRDELVNIERSLNNRERKLEDLIANQPDTDQAYAALNETKINASREVYKVTLKMLRMLEELRMISVRESFLRVALKHLQDERIKVENELQSLEERLQDNMSLMETHVVAFRSIKSNLIRMTESLHDQCGLKTLNPEQMTRQEKKILAYLEELFLNENVPDDMSAIVQLLEEEKIKLDIVTVDGSKEDVDRCESLEKEKISLVSRKEQQEATREEWKANLMKEITEWREPIEKLIRNININYSKFFAQIGCAGEVYLDVPEDPLNIAEYGIMVMVSFRRGERLRRLDHQVQSGGERSVSTMLYLLALQELCPVPFRCVDEINQGMDPVNERNVFSIIVDTLSGEGNLSKTQYFLLTPKLLHGLQFNSKVTMQFVHNGPTLSKDCSNLVARNIFSIERLGP